MTHSADQDRQPERRNNLSEATGPFQQLVGQRIGVTASRRGEDMCAALEQRGAQVIHAPALASVAIDQDVAVIEATRAIVQQPPEAVLVSTGYGLRRWLETAEATGHGEDLRSVLCQAEMVVRGSKALGQVQALELTPRSVTKVRDLNEGVEHILSGTPGRVAVQLPGTADDDTVRRLRAAGAAVDTVIPYRLHQAARPSVQTLLQEACAHRVDTVVFNAAPAVDAVMEVARSMNLYQEIIEALRDGSVTAAAVGTVCARPLREVGVQPLVPQRPRIAELVGMLCTRADQQRVQVETTHGPLILRGLFLQVDGHSLWLTHQQVALLRALIQADGAVVSRAQLIKCIPGLEGTHALEMTVSRLRRKLPVPLVQTVIKRGYRLDRFQPRA